MTAYYNENNPYAAQWLRNLISADLIAPGDVDERSIKDVQPDDLRGYTQCHFFAGIGGWSYALRLALWPDDRPVWTGSCPCQPFSSAGNKAAQSDERHLWPHWYRLIKQSKPSAIFGEQVDDAIALGWLDDAFNDLEAENYACASAVLPACSIGAPHPRDRLWFVADTNSSRECGELRKETATTDTGEGKAEKRQRIRLLSGGIGNVENSECGRSPQSRGDKILFAPAENRKANYAFYASEISDLEWLHGPDGKLRPIKSDIRLLADGVPSRLGKLCALGNAIVPQVAASFIQAYCEAVSA